MKLKISIILLLILSQKAICFSQDTLVLIKQSRISYCLSKIEQVKIANERITLKDSVINTLNKRIENKELEIGSYKRDIDAYKNQLEIKKFQEEVLTEQIAIQKDQIHQLKKKSVVQKVGLITLTIFSLWVLIQ